MTNFTRLRFSSLIYLVFQLHSTKGLAGDVEEEKTNDGDRQRGIPDSRPACATHEGIAAEFDVIAGGKDGGNKGEGKGDVAEGIDESREQEGRQEADRGDSLNGSILGGGADSN